MTDLKRHLSQVEHYLQDTVETLLATTLESDQP